MSGSSRSSGWTLPSPASTLPADLSPATTWRCASDAGEALARVPVREAFTGSAEVFPEQPGEPITRVDVERPQGAFTVVLPAPRGSEAYCGGEGSTDPPSVPRVDAGATSPLPASPEVRELASFPLELSD